MLAAIDDLALTWEKRSISLVVSSKHLNPSGTFIAYVRTTKLRLSLFSMFSLPTKRY